MAAVGNPVGVEFNLHSLNLYHFTIVLWSLALMDHDGFFFMFWSAQKLNFLKTINSLDTKVHKSSK